MGAPEAVDRGGDKRTNIAMDWLPTKEIKRTCGQDSLEWNLQGKRWREPEAPKHLKANKDVGTLGERTHVAKDNIKLVLKIESDDEN